MDITKHGLKSLSISKHTYKSFKTMDLVIVTENWKGQTETVKFVLHTHAKKFPKITVGKIQRQS